MPTQGIVDRIYATVPAAYFVWAVPFLLTICWLTPAWQNPDEPAHFVRADQVAHGQVIGSRIGPLLAGGDASANILLSDDPVAGIRFHGDRTVSRAMLAQVEALQWGPRSFVANPNTVQYPPFFYIPQALAVRLGEAQSYSIAFTLRLARVSVALLSSVACLVAFMVARRAMAFMLVVTMLPENMALFASASQDGLMFAAMLLAIGILDRVASEERDASLTENVTIVVLLALVTMARPPYLPLGLLGLLVTRRIGRRCIGSAVAIIGVTMLWLLAATIFTSVPMNGAEPGHQLHFMLAHPYLAVSALLDTFKTSYVELTLEMIGTLGWNDTRLSPWSYNLFGFLLCVCGFTALGGRARRHPIAALVVGLIAVMIAVAQYIAWTGVGASSVSGLQGRYFEVPLLVCVLALPGVPVLKKFLRPIALLPAAVAATIVPLVMLRAIVWRYYFQ